MRMTPAKDGDGYQGKQVEITPECHTEARKYLPTLSDLVDRLTIAMQKFIFLPGHEGEYQQEIDDLRHDVRLICGEKVGELVYGVIAVTLANRCIWENETHIRDGSSTETSDIQLQRLRKTHSVNGVRNTAKNFISALYGGRKDYKIDTLAADLPPEFGNWRLF